MLAAMLLPDRSIRRSLSLALAGALLCVAVQASPQVSADPVASLLQERGITPPTPLPAPPQAAPHAPSFVEKVRDSASGMAVSAMNFLGVRYVRGGNNAEEGFDCSGFTRYIFENSLGLILPRRADEQATDPGLVKVKRNELQPGDLVFFNTLRRTFSHVGIYLGEDKFIHAPRAGGNVRVENMKISYWAKRFTGARRAPGAEAPESRQNMLAAPAAPAPAPAAAAPAAPARQTVATDPAYN
jgi:cell wall-associated NlpC family hydrolase